MLGTRWLEMVSSHFRWSVWKQWSLVRAAVSSSATFYSLKSQAWLERAEKLNLKDIYLKMASSWRVPAQVLLSVVIVFPPLNPATHSGSSLALGCASPWAYVQMLCWMRVSPFFTLRVFFPSPLFVPISSRCLWSRQNSYFLFCIFRKFLLVMFWSFSTHCYYLSFLLSFLPPCRPALLNVLVWWEHHDKTWIKTVDVCDLF